MIRLVKKKVNKGSGLITLNNNFFFGGGKWEGGVGGDFEATFQKHLY